MCWRVVVPDIHADTHQALFGLMTPEEQERAERFVQAEDRRSFTAAHGGLRLLLGAMLHVPPEAPHFILGEFGKPGLSGRTGIEFNMSHSGGVVLIGLARGMAIGVDVERRRFVHERTEIVRRYLHPGEAAELGALAENAAENAFFRCWSRKEAVVKALGRGMNLELDRYRVSCMPDAAPALLALEGDPAPVDAWTIIDLDPSPDHVGAVAARRRPLNISCASLDVVAALASLPDRN